MTPGLAPGPDAATVANEDLANPLLIGVRNLRNEDDRPALHVALDAASRCGDYGHETLSLQPLFSTREDAETRLPVGEAVSVTARARRCRTVAGLLALFVGSLLGKRPPLPLWAETAPEPA